LSLFFCSTLDFYYTGAILHQLAKSNIKNNK
jgi:hypothetical protein